MGNHSSLFICLFVYFSVRTGEVTHEFFGLPTESKGELRGKGRHRRTARHNPAGQRGAGLGEDEPAHTVCQPRAARADVSPYLQDCPPPQEELL